MKKNPLVGELLAEFAGTMILILFGVGVVAQVVGGGLGDHDSIAWAWGLGVTLGVYVAARISGAHLNPGGDDRAGRLQGIPLAEGAAVLDGAVPGAFVAALIVRWNYTEVLHSVDPGLTIKTQGVFSTLPGNGALPSRHVGALPRPDHRHGDPAVRHPGADRRPPTSPPLANLAPAHDRPARRRRSAWRGAPTPATRSTRPVTSGPGWRRSSPVTGAP